jgi:hypothetical protein
MPNFNSPRVLGQDFFVHTPEDNDVIIKIVNYDAPAVVRIVPSPGARGITGPQGPQGIQGVPGDGLSSVSSPLVYNSQTQSISFDQTAQNTTNDLRYIRKTDAIDAGVI